MEMKQRSEIRNCFSLEQMTDCETRTKKLNMWVWGNPKFFMNIHLNSHFVALVSTYSGVFWKIPCGVPRDSQTKLVLGTGCWLLLCITKPASCILGKEKAFLYASQH